MNATHTVGRTDPGPASDTRGGRVIVESAWDCPARKGPSTPDGPLLRWWGSAAEVGAGTLTSNSAAVDAG